MTAFPLQLSVPDELKHTTAACVQRVRMSREGCAEMARQRGGVIPYENEECVLLPLYPAPECLRTCKDVPFAYTSWQQVVAWILAEVGDWAVEWATANAHRLPFFDENAFIADLEFRHSEATRATESMIRAHRICAALSVYLVLPYIIIALILLAYLTNLLALLGAQLYPVLLCVTSLFAAVSAQGDKLNEALRDSDRDSDDSETEVDAVADW